jgi:hypothetical protein
VSFGAPEIDTWTDLCLGPALDVKYLVPLDRQLSLILDGEVGYYFLAGSSVDISIGGINPETATATLNSSNVGELLGFQLEWLTAPGWAVDFGFGYRFLQFTTINFVVSSTGGFKNSGVLPNSNNGNAFMDFSGPQFSLGVRFF